MSARALPNELGAGVLMTPNAIHGLNFLGVGDQITASSSRSRGHEYRHYRTGEVLQRRPPAEAYAASYGAGVYYVHRADLHGALLAAVLANDPDCLHCGHAFTDFSQDEEGVVARFANGACVEGRRSDRRRRMPIRRARGAAWARARRLYGSGRVPCAGPEQRAFLMATTTGVRCTSARAVCSCRIPCARTLS